MLLIPNGGSDKYTITRNQQWGVTALAELSSGTVVERYTYDAFGKRTILAAVGSTVRTVSSYASSSSALIDLSRLPPESYSLMDC